MKHHHGKRLQKYLLTLSVLMFFCIFGQTALTVDISELDRLFGNVGLQVLLKESVYYHDYINILLSKTPPVGFIPFDIKLQAISSGPVYLEMTDPNNNSISYGSGFFVSPTHIVTNLHVVAGAAKGTAGLVAGISRDHYSVSVPIEGVVATDTENDLALLEVKVPKVKIDRGWRIEMPKINPLKLGESDKVQIDDPVYVMGNREGMSVTLSDGVVSHIGKIRENRRFEMTTYISPGSNGGAILNARKEVIGVAFSSIVEHLPQSYAIPAEYVKKLLKAKKTLVPLSETANLISAQTYLHRGNTKLALKLYPAAFFDYERAIQLKPDYAEAYNNRGIIRTIQHRYNEAILEYEKATQLAPDIPHFHYHYGNANQKLGNLTAALTNYDTAIRLQKDFARAYNQRANVLNRLGKHTEAILVVHSLNVYYMKDVPNRSKSPFPSLAVG